MRLSRPSQVILSAAAAIVLAGCSNQGAFPTAPSRLDSSQAALSANTASTETSTIANAPAPDRSTANFEISFMTGMIDHHQMAVEMAEVCVAKAVHEELRSMCQDIIAAQSAEIRKMQSWLQQWYGVTYQPTMKPGDQKMIDRMASMSGAEFEIAFMEMMIEHHEKAIAEAERCLDRAAHPELRTLCRNIIRTQSAEIAQMETWLCQWYGRCQ